MKAVWTMWLMPILENLRKINTGNKASGLLDQMACSVGGLITIDFVDAYDSGSTEDRF